MCNLKLFLNLKVYAFCNLTKHWQVTQCSSIITKRDTHELSCIHFILHNIVFKGMRNSVEKKRLTNSVS